MSKRFTRKLRQTNAGHGKDRVDVTIPPAVLKQAGIEGGDVVEIRVLPSKRIILLPLRTGWPKECAATTDCRRAEGHEGECIVEVDVPW